MSATGGREAKEGRGRRDEKEEEKGKKKRGERKRAGKKDAVVNARSLSIVSQCTYEHGEAVVCC